MNRIASFESYMNEYNRDRRSMSYSMDGWLDDIFSGVGTSFTDAIAGLTRAVSGALEATLQAIKHINETIALVVRAAIGDVSWNEVLNEMGQVFQDIGSVMVYLNPDRISYEFLSESPLTSHAFYELDKFTGGMITTARNVSTLPGRAMRGDPISKVELIQDALFAVTVVSIVYGGPVVLGAMIGTMVGREVCSKQTEAKDACMVAFQIVGAAAGSYASSVTGVTWGSIADESASGFTQEEQQAWLNGPESYADYQARQAALSSGSFLPHLSAAGENYLTTAGITRASQVAAQICQSAHVMGRNECRIISQVMADYIKSPQDITWEEFLAQEVARIGAEQLMLQWFPPDTPEHQAIQWRIKYVDVAQDQELIVEKKIDPKMLLLLAGGVTVMLLGASS